MQRLAELARRLLFVFRRGRVDRDLAREMAFHLEMQAEENRDLGMQPDEAASAASRQFGNATLLRESSREAWGWMWLERLGQDVHYALRVVRRNPAFAATTVAVLALGIGGNTAIFSLTNALVLSPFPYPEADRLVTVDARRQANDWTTPPISLFFAWQEQGAAFDSFAAYGWSRSNVAGGTFGSGTPERLVGGRASASFLRVLQVRPVLGRFFSTDEDQPGGPPVVLLGYELWQRRFSGSHDVLGRHLTLNGRPFTIIGIMPSRLPLPGMFACEFWTPIAYSHQYADTTVWTGDNYVGRLKHGVTFAGAEAQLNGIVRARENTSSALGRGWRARVRDIGADVRDEASPAVQVLAVAVGLVLLLACVNLAGLLLARGEARNREMAVRASLGASRRRLVRQMLTESVLLSLCGGAIGLLVAAWGVNTLAAAAPPRLGLVAAVRMDLPVLAFAFVLSCLTGLLFGLIPALRGSKANLSTTLKAGASGWSAARRGRRTLPLLVVTEIALAVVLLTAGGLLMKSFVGLRRVNPGLRADHVLTFELALNRSSYDSPAKVRAFTDALLERLRTIPGVGSVAAVDPLPMSQQYSGSTVEIDGHRVDESLYAQYLSARAGYFRTMGIPVLHGREFSESDERSGSAEGIVVNQEFVRVFLPKEDPLVQTMHGVPIIGVVGNIRHNGPARPPDPQIYSSMAAHPDSAFGVAVRTTVNPTSILGAVRADVQSLDRDLPLYRVRTMERMMDDVMADARLTSTAVFAFAIFALVLATIGIYGVIAYSVGQRAHEIGVRVALGASKWQVLALMLRTTVWLALAGVVIGVPTALALSRFIGALLVGVSPRDATVLAAVPVLLVAVALAASYVPARGATRINPLDALRCE